MDNPVTKKKSGLGRQGLGVLLTGHDENTNEQDQNQFGRLRMIPIESIKANAYQPRKSFDPEALQELADSIQVHGVIQPILLRQSIISGQYELIAGERRWRAAQLNGLKEIPAIVREVANQSAAAISLIENIQRQQLSALEEAHALQRLMTEFGLTHQQIAESVGRSRAAVSNALRLLDLCDFVKNMLNEGELDMGHARALLAIKKPKEQQHVAEIVVAKKLSVRATEEWVKKYLDPDTISSNKASSNAPEIERLQKDLSEWIGANVRIKQSKSGKGQLLIAYQNQDELYELIQQFKAL